MGTEHDDNKLQAWREEKECEWEGQGGNLRKRYPTRAKFDAWMDKQCAKARHIACAIKAGPTADACKETLEGNAMCR